MVPASPASQPHSNAPTLACRFELSGEPSSSARRPRRALAAAARPPARPCACAGSSRPTEPHSSAPGALDARCEVAANPFIAGAAGTRDHERWGLQVCSPVSRPPAATALATTLAASVFAASALAAAVLAVTVASFALATTASAAVPGRVCESVYSTMYVGPVGCAYLS